MLVALREGPLRFNGLRRNIPGISQKMLSLTLRGLERDGLIARTVMPTIPLRVEYELTPLGHSLRNAVETVGLWAIANHPAMQAAQNVFDQRDPCASVCDLSIAG